MDFEPSFNIVLGSLRQCLSLPSAETFTRGELYYRERGERERERERGRENSRRDTKVLPAVGFRGPLPEPRRSDVELTPEKCVRARTPSTYIRRALPSVGCDLLEGFILENCRWFFDAIASCDTARTQRGSLMLFEQGKHERKVAYPPVDRQAARVYTRTFCKLRKPCVRDSASYFISGKTDVLAKAVFVMVERLTERSIAAEIH